MAIGGDLIIKTMCPGPDMVSVIGKPVRLLNLGIGADGCNLECRSDCRMGLNARLCQTPCYLGWTEKILEVQKLSEAVLREIVDFGKFWWYLFM
ncbi:hypothetical protein Nepgr_015571 [Nepenthes gracilis]|uniref:Uncharacterized protein n=1 Tax=Nepenthes gracilis TaxID=150966 RepID=A0AAD3SL98_NEPGR|nr:hypothetical protein Nepgr_015571 [Nepenthes gracilis]